MSLTSHESTPAGAARRGRGRGRRGKNSALAQPPWSRVESGLSPVALLSEEEVESVHDTSMRVLEELGIELMSARARALFRRAGAEVDEDTGTVRLDRGLLLELVAKAPPAFALTPRNPGRAVHIGGRDVVATLVAGPPAVHDCVNGRRASNLADYENFLRLTHSFNAVHMIGNQVSAPTELDAETRHLDCYLANLTLTDRSYHCTAIGRTRALDGIEMMAIARGMSLEEMAESPGVATIISVNSPRRFDEAMAEGLITMAEHGQAVAVTPFTLMGAMTPVTLAAALAQQNAEALFGIALAQLVRPGAPVLYGAFTSNVDMRTGAPAFGTPENAKANIASGQLARRYGLPYRATPSNASNAADAQATWETMMSLWGCVMGGANMLYHGAGWLEGGLCASYEKFVLDVEMLNHLYAFLAPTRVDEASLGFEALARVPTGGHFFGDPHTLERYRTAFYAPMLSDWRNHEAWTADGAKTATERATALWQAALAEYEAPPMDPGIREALAAHVARRKEEIERAGL
jgi:trimethylamine--corrinoid protein Co-methyltransferase